MLLCISGLGDRWGPVILEERRETIVLKEGVTESCQLYWISGSTNVSSPDPESARTSDGIIYHYQYIPNDSDIISSFMGYFLSSYDH